MRQMYDALVAEAHHLAPSAYSPENPPPYFVRLFEHVAEHEPFYRLMLCGEGVGRFQRLVKAYVAEAAEREFASGHRALTAPLALRVQFLAGGVLSILTWWLEHDRPLSPRQMAQYLAAQHAPASLHP
jgi:hypothetical protein